MASQESRRFEVATDGSDLSELLCVGILEPLADQLAGEKFNESQLARVDQERSVVFFDERIVVLSFSAMKTHIDFEERRILTHYNASVTVVRPRIKGEYWPTMIDVVDEDAMYDDEEELESFVEDESYEIDVDNVSNEDNIDVDLEMCYVKEVWDFIVDDEQYRTRKDIRYEYYFGNTLVDLIIMNDNPQQAIMLSEDMEEDTDLTIKDACFASSYSEFDLEVIEAISTFNFPKAKTLLETAGLINRGEELSSWDMLPPSDTL